MYNTKFIDNFQPKQMRSYFAKTFSGGFNELHTSLVLEDSEAPTVYIRTSLYTLFISIKFWMV